jgi:hypothetical protein
MSTTSEAVAAVAKLLGEVIAELEDYPDDADNLRYQYLLGKKAAYISAFKELTR